MTRETKIGLLVGLAFIIVIGILLSDHLTSSTEPPPATLANAGSNVMQTINAPGSTTDAQAQAVTPPQDVAPNQPVPTTADLTPRPKPVQVVQVGPGPGAAPITVQSQQQPAADAAPIVMTAQQAPIETPADTDDDAPVITHATIDPASSLAQEAQRSGEALVAVESSGRPATVSYPPAWTQGKPGAREHVAEPGDSVSRMAARFLGGNTKTNRDAIIKANPSLQKDPNRVIIGQTYVIPTGPQMAAAPAPQPALQPAATETTASATEYWYTVKENDSLWKIAAEQLGNPGAVAAIKELNQIQDENLIRAGTKLKLPGKPIAQAN